MSCETIQYWSRSPEATSQLGVMIGQLAQPGAVVLLQGELGAGKTHLAQGIARGLGVPNDEPVASPSYTLLNIYQARLQLAHFDLYRLGEVDELDELGFQDYLADEGVVMIEWIDRFPHLRPEGLWLKLEYAGKVSERQIRLQSTSIAMDSLMQQLHAALCREVDDESI